MTFHDGTKYVGEWRGNERSGRGEYTSSDGRTESGVWNKGSLEKKYSTEQLSNHTALKFSNLSNSVGSVI
jgi:hypothetical protein